MRKPILIGLSLALVLSLISTGCSSNSAPATETPAATEAAAVAGSWDFDAAYAALEPDTEVMTINGQSLRWDAYFYWLSSLLQSVSPKDIASWDGAIGDGTDTEYGEYFLQLAQRNAAQFCIMDDLADAAGITLTQEDETAMEESRKQDIEAYGNGTEKGLQSYLASLRMPEDYYTAINRSVLRNSKRFAQTYGELGENLTDEDVMSFAEGRGYVYGMQLLCQTSQDEDAAAQRAELEQLRDSLVGEEGTAAIGERFAALAEENEYGEISATLFDPEAVSQAFSEALQQLENYHTTIVEDTEGLHLVLRLPLKPDTVVGNDAAGAPLDLRYLTAAWLDDNTISEALENCKVEYSKAFSELDMNQLFPLEG